MASLLTNKPIRNDVAMTGEITLRGLVLPVGGIKEKFLAAHRAGIKRVILPERNRKDVIDIPEQPRNEIEILYVKRMDELLPLVLTEMPKLGVLSAPSLSPASAPPPPRPRERGLFVGGGSPRIVERVPVITPIRFLIALAAVGALGCGSGTSGTSGGGGSSCGSGTLRHLWRRGLQLWLRNVGDTGKRGNRRGRRIIRQWRGGIERRERRICGQRSGVLVSSCLPQGVQHGGR